MLIRSLIPAVPSLIDSLSVLPRTSVCSLHATTSNFAPPKKTGAFKAGMTVAKKKMEVESDPQKLVSYLCGGNYKKDSPEIKLGNDSDYPDWLWNMRLDGQDPSLDELDPNSVEYWMEIRRLKEIANKRVMKSLNGKLWQFRRENRYQMFVIAKKKALAERALQSTHPVKYTITSRI